MKNTLSVEPTTAIRGNTAYTVPRALTPIDLKLDSNEGSLPPEKLLQIVSGLSPEILRRYPKKDTLEALLADSLGVEATQVLVTAGGDEAINAAIRAVLEPGSELILLEPTFEMIPRYASLAGGKIVSIPWIEQEFPLEEVIARVNPNTAVISIVSPNNPTGWVVGAETLRKLSAAAPNALLLVDLAYTEFADVDLTPVALELPNAVVIRTFSKAWGLAGLRIGYAVASETLISWMRTASSPYPCNGVGLYTAIEQFKAGKTDLQSTVRQVRKERAALEDLLRELGAEVTPSQGNFVFANFSDPTWVRDALAGLGIAVRIFPGKAYLENSLRISCPGNQQEFERLARALRTAIAPEAILFDMDGVLADTSTSYREAIRQTVQSFGLDVTLEEISETKTEPNSNNDWEVSLRIIERAGIEASLEEVTKRFEALYQGTSGNVGLKSRETLIPDRELLEELSQRLPLAIVTGRPRSDALYFLQTSKIEQYFSCMVCMGEAAAKPNPAPVIACLEQLGAKSAWLIGDTPDDMQAARAANVLPLGVISGTDDSSKALQLAGAGRILDSNLAELKERLR